VRLGYYADIEIKGEIQMESVMELPITLDLNLLCGGCKFWDGFTKHESCVDCYGNDTDLFAYSIEQNGHSDMTKPVVAGIVVALFVGVAVIGYSWLLQGK
jgi:hypothetical protein